MSGWWSKWRAQPSGVEPNRWSRRSGSAPRRSRVRASSRFPSSAALCRAVCQGWSLGTSVRPLALTSKPRPARISTALRAAAGGRPGDQGLFRRTHLACQPGLLAEQPVEAGPVGGQRRRDERLGRIQAERRGAVLDQVADQVGVAGGGGHGGRGGAALERGRHVDAVADQQPDPFGQAVGDGPGQLAAEHLGRGVDGIAEPPAPRPAVAGAQAELEEQLQVVVTGLEHPVVERLAVVRVGARLRRPGRTGAATGRGRPRGGRRRDRRPACARSASGVGRRGGRVDAARGDLGVPGQQTASLRPASAGCRRGHQAEELIGQAGGCSGRHAVGEAAVALDDLDVPLEAGPAGEAVPAGHDELRGVQRKRGGRVGEALGGLGERAGLAREDGPAKVLGPVAKLLVTGLIGEVGHSEGSFRMPAVRVDRPKGGVRRPDSPCDLRRALPFPRTGGPLRACFQVTGGLTMA